MKRENANKIKLGGEEVKDSRYPYIEEGEVLPSKYQL